MPNSDLKDDHKINTKRKNSMDAKNIIECCNSPGIRTRAQLKRMSINQTNKIDDVEIDSQIATPRKTPMRGKKVAATPKNKSLFTPKKLFSNNDLNEESLTPNKRGRISTRLGPQVSKQLGNEIQDTCDPPSTPKRGRKKLNPIPSSPLDDFKNVLKKLPSPKLDNAENTNDEEQKVKNNSPNSPIKNNINERVPDINKSKIFNESEKQKSTSQKLENEEFNLKINKSPKSPIKNHDKNITDSKSTPKKIEEIKKYDSIQSPKLVNKDSSPRKKIGEIKKYDAIQSPKLVNKESTPRKKIIINDSPSKNKIEQKMESYSPNLRISGEENKEMEHDSKNINDNLNEFNSKNTDNSFESPSKMEEKESSCFRSPTNTSKKVFNTEIQKIKANLNTYDEESDDSDSDAESRKAIKRSAEKRIIENMSNSSESEVRTSLPKKLIINKEVNKDESDSAPEDISFNQTKMGAMESKKKETDSIKYLKNLKKEKKRQRLELIKRQKEEKLIRLKEKRASEENASCSSSEETGYEDESYQPSQNQTNLNKEKENFDVFPNSPVVFDNNDSSSGNNIESKKRSKPSSSLAKLSSEVLDSLNEPPPKKIKKHNFVTSSTNEQMDKSKINVKAKRLESLDYIPISTETSTTFGVVALNSTMGTTSMAAAAAAFRDQRLFKGTHVQRINVKTLNSFKQKKQLLKQ